MRYKTYRQALRQCKKDVLAALKDQGIPIDSVQMLEDYLVCVGYLLAKWPRKYSYPTNRK